MTENLLICLAAGLLMWTIAILIVRREGAAPWWLGMMLWFASGFMAGSWVMFMLWWLR